MELRPRVLYVEPWEGGSHARLGAALAPRVELVRACLPARHWKWRMRGSAAWFARSEPVRDFRGGAVLASSYVPLAELLGLCPHLLGARRVLYFHENQLTYPVRPGAEAERDHHFGFTQLVSALAADVVVFNSDHNRRSFLDAGARLLQAMPDAVRPGWIDEIRSRSRVLGVPLRLPELGDDAFRDPHEDRDRGPIVLWNHRWEFDKGPDRFFGALERLAARGTPFRVAVCGQAYARSPDCFERARPALGSRVVHWGWLPDPAAYWRLLTRAHLAVSTAEHEFFGLSMLEATWAGARPLVPDRLVYPELYPDELRYRDDDELVERLDAACRAWTSGADLRGDRRDLVRPHSEAELVPRFVALLSEA